MALWMLRPMPTPPPLPLPIATQVEPCAAWSIAPSTGQSAIASEPSFSTPREAQLSPRTSQRSRSGSSRTIIRRAAGPRNRSRIVGIRRHRRGFRAGVFF